jgi:hypothetical protein
VPRQLERDALWALNTASKNLHDQAAKDGLDLRASQTEYGSQFGKSDLRFLTQAGESVCLGCGKLDTE